MAGRLEVPHRRLWLAVAYVLVALLATVGATLGQSMLTAIRADGWPRGQARVVKSQLRQPQSGSTSSLVAEVAFNYVIQNASYTTSRLSAMDWWCTYPKAIPTLDRFSLNAVVEIAVNPDDPAEAYVQTGFRWAHLASAIQVLPLVSLLGYAWLASLRRVPYGATVVGPFLAYADPLPRLVLVRTTALQIGLLGITLTGVCGIPYIGIESATDPTWQGNAMIPPGINPGPGDLRHSILFAVAGSVCGGLLAIGWRLVRQRRFGLQLIVDTQHKALILPKPLLRKRPNMPLDDIRRMEVRTVRARSEAGTLHYYEVWIVGHVAPSRRILTCRVASHGRGVTQWVNETLEASGCGQIDVYETV